ncbi:MAG TPA: DNRLRE domain-containing protein [Verrucomicrobiae bacterium]|nr:DNRLRE domain-containing protein [Verrucomicrobiae bacterium]
MKKIGLTILAIVSLTIGNIWAGEIRQNVGDAAFVSKAEQTQQEIFKFDLPEIPEGSRIDFAGLILHVQRDSTRGDYLSFKLSPITSDWTASSIQGGQVLSVDETTPAYAVADVNRSDKIELDITQLAASWFKGEKTNRGFILATEFPEEQTKFAAKSNVGAKAELVIYYTGPEKK